jgi:hypothetical protein
MAFMFSMETVMPPSILDPPANEVWPPDFTANGHCVKRDTKTIAETSKAFEGLKTQRGFTSACCADQYASVNALYNAEFSERTLALP